ncbi:MAG TPA: alpha/beta hydrolase [Polyangia bacterium]|jgi:pimeloyl-ACP methyl ester carboxylesterase
MPHAIGPGGARIFYESQGRGPAVVLIQGLGLSSRFWFDIPARLAARYRVVTIDNRGVGRSDRPGGLYRMGTMARDVVAVLDQQGLERAVVVGISLGGMIAQHVTLRYPGRVRGLVLLASTPGLPHGSLPGVEVLAALVSLPFARPGSSAAFARLLLPRRHLPRARELFARWPAALAQDPVSPRIFLAQLAAAAAHSTGWRLGEIRCPTVVIAGADDVLIPPHNSRVLARRIPRAVLEIVPDVGHALPLLDEVVVERALARLAQLTAGAGTA